MSRYITPEDVIKMISELRNKDYQVSDHGASFTLRAKDADEYTSSYNVDAEGTIIIVRRYDPDWDDPHYVNIKRVLFFAQSEDVITVTGEQDYVKMIIDNLPNNDDDE